VEEAPATDLFDRPGHPYTKGLLGSIPHLDTAAHNDTRRARLTEIKGMQYNPLTGRYWLSGDTGVNYLVACTRPA
jgi:ABC-type dipeptide/oligopeptide/nickel transport system ATPase component